jgi:uncharacterized integral membrane protein
MPELSEPPPHVPAPGNGAPGKDAAAAVGQADGTVIPSPSPSAPPRTHKSKRHKRHRQKRRTKREARWQIVVGCAMALILILIVFLVARNADRWWQIFKFRPQRPEMPMTSSAP